MDAAPGEVKDSMAADRSDARRAALEVLRDELAGGRYLMAPRNKKGRGARDEGRGKNEVAVPPDVAQPSPPAPRPPPPTPEGGPPRGLASSRDAGLVEAKPLTDPAKSPGERLAELARLSEKCKQCELNKTRNKLVFGDGKPGAELLFVGEAPGADEDATGVPFVGRAGQLLNKIIAAMGLSREEHVYICNVLKCRPPGNRTPLPSEAAECWPHLREQIEIVGPKVICTSCREV